MCCTNLLPVVTMSITQAWASLSWCTDTVQLEWLKLREVRYRRGRLLENAFCRSLNITDPLFLPHNQRDEVGSELPASPKPCETFLKSSLSILVMGNSTGFEYFGHARTVKYLNVVVGKPFTCNTHTIMTFLLHTA
uniref:ORF86 n=1 Tax=Malaco herpesvirus 4 TaxID=3031800 RepID=A0AA48P7Q7_9VIRU|nr:TPA_asm: ORF86 [Malaco herpesvirus 4]